MLKFPSSGNIYHAAVQTDVTSLKVVPKSGNSDKEINSDKESSVVQLRVVSRGQRDVNLVGRGHKNINLVGRDHKDVRLVGKVPKKGIKNHKNLICFKIIPANVRLEAYNRSAITVKGFIKFTNFLCNLLLKDVKFLAVDKFCSNNLQGKDLIERLNLFPGVKKCKFKAV